MVFSFVILLGSCKKTDNMPTEEGLTAGEIELLDFTTYYGEYVEDGSDEQVIDVAAITVVNNSKTAYQLIRFEVMANGENYHFTVTALLPGMTVTALETDKKTITAGTESTFFRITESSEFAVEPSKHEDLFRCELYDGVMNVTNISDKAFDKDVFVYYKNKNTSGYLGGITYRVNCGSLEKGKLTQRPSAHLKQGTSEVLFITYGE